MTAEFVKVLENTQRNVNIALINLSALVADKLDIDVQEALKAAATKWNFINFKPGCGVGGECIDDSAKMLTEAMEDLDICPSLVKESSRINAIMPVFTVSKAKEACEKMNLLLEDVHVGVLGLAYKGNSSDIRNSPSLKVIRNLQEVGFKHIVAYDSLVSQEIQFSIKRANTLEEALTGRDLVIIATDHPEFKNVDGSLLDKCSLKAIVDGRNCLEKELVESKGIVYYGIGR